VFTNALDQVVFVDGNFLELMNRPEVGRIIGEPLDKVLGLERQIVKQLMQDMVQAGFLQDFPLEVSTTTGTAVHILCSGVATYDDKENFIGADLTLREAIGPGLSRALRPHDEDSFSRLARQTLAEARALEDQVYLQQYFTAQVNALQVLLARMGGVRIRDTLERIFNKSARRNVWPISMKDGQITIEAKDLETGTYRTLLSKLVDYVVSVVSQRMMLRAVCAVDEQMEAKVLELADRAGLRISSWLSKE
jgi:hypothetical protein